MESPRGTGVSTLPAATRVVYDIDDKPALREAVPLGFQHVVAMLLGNITPPLLITGALAMALADQALILQMVLLMAGLATVVQAYPLGPVGGRIPVIMGTSIAFVGAANTIGREHGLAVVFGACLVAATVEIALGFSIVRVRRMLTRAAGTGSPSSSTTVPETSEAASSATSNGSTRGISTPPTVRSTKPVWRNRMCSTSAMRLVTRVTPL